MRMVKGILGRGMILLGKILEDIAGTCMVEEPFHRSVFALSWRGLIQRWCKYNHLRCSSDSLQKLLAV
jgi:hypothetical protein